MSQLNSVVLSNCFYVARAYADDVICGTMTGGSHPQYLPGNTIQVLIPRIKQVKQNTTGNFVLITERSEYEISSFSDDTFVENRDLLKEMLKEQFEKATASK